MKFKRIITIALLGILAFLMVRSVQAADVVQTAKQATESLTIIEPGTFSKIGNTLGEYAASAVNSLEKKSDITINPISITKKTYFFVKDHPWTSLGLFFGSLFIYNQYAQWYNKHATSLRELGAKLKDIHEGRTKNDVTNQTYITTRAESYRTWYGREHTLLKETVNKYFYGQVKDSFEDYKTIMYICGYNI